MSLLAGNDQVKTPILMKIVVHTSHPLGEEKLRKLSTVNTSIEYNIKVFYPFSNHRLKEAFSPRSFQDKRNYDRSTKVETVLLNQH